MATYIIFGATGAIGSATAELLSKNNDTLVLVGSNEESLNEIRGTLNSLCIKADVTKQNEVESVFTTAIEKYGSIDGVLHAVGSIILKPAHLTTAAEWDSTILLNLTSAFYVVQASAKHMKAGSVVLFSSAAARIGLASHEAIAAAKAGVIGLMQSAAASYASRGLRFNCIAPGLVRSTMSQKIVSNPTAEKASVGFHPLGRLGEASDIASMAAWLISPQSSWTTGQVFGIDGGLGTLKTKSL